MIPNFTLFSVISSAFYYSSSFSFHHYVLGTFLIGSEIYCLRAYTLMKPKIIEKIVALEDGMILITTLSGVKEIDSNTIKIDKKLDIPNDFKVFTRVEANGEFFLSSFGIVNNKELFEKYFGKLL